MKMWEELGMERMEFRDHPQRAMLIRRIRGVKIFSGCEWNRLLQATKNPVRHLVGLYNGEVAQVNALKAQDSRLAVHYPGHPKRFY